MYDLIIIGAGPAGTTAAVYAARQKLNTLILTINIGGQAAWSGTVENYTGFQIIPGVELAHIFEDHVRKYVGQGIEIKENEPVQKIIKKDEGYEVVTEKNTYQSRTIIIASGKVARKLGVPGEEELKSRGVTYCATCDGPLFAGKDVAVIGGGNSALDAVLQLTQYARSIYLTNVNAQLAGDAILIEKVKACANVEIINEAQTKDFFGDRFLAGMTIVKDGKERKLAVQGAFIEVGLLPNSDLGLEIKKNKYQEILIDNKNATSLPGVFAAGDVTDIPEKQIIISAGEGAKAAMGAVKYLNQTVSVKGGSNKMAKYRCLVCNYIYDPMQNNNISFTDLPEDWTCPECGVGKDQFVEEK
jgi:alkyl hydroperoxide reductase subunit F